MGVPVYNIAGTKAESTVYSKYCRHGFVVPGIEVTPRLLRHTLRQVGRRIQLPAVVFPTSDAAVTTLSHVMPTLPQYVASIPSHAIVQRIVNKTQFYASLRDHRVPHPETLPFPESSIDEIQRHLAFPVFIKPVYSQPFVALFRRKGFTAHSEQELRMYLELVEQHQQPVLVQEIIPGPVPHGYILRGYFDRESTPRALLLAQRIRQPSMFSNVSCMISIPRHQLQGFDHVILEYLRNLHYHGLFVAEIKRDPRDHAFKLIEINARSAGANALSARCGAYEVQYAYWEALGTTCSTPSSATLGVYFINEYIDIRSIASMIRYRSGSLTTLLRSYLGNTQFGGYSRDDPQPSFMAWLQKAMTRVRAS
jgi:predicted ATP-grasp superfamily ATP-dependent carboligase